MPMMTRHFAVWPEAMPKTLDLPEQTLCANLEHSAARFGDRPALIFHGRSLSYADLLEAVERLAGWLQQAAGVRRGDRVLLYMQNSPQFVIGYYAILRADAVVVPVNPMSRHAELEHLARDTGAQVMLAGQEGLEHAAPLVASGLLSHIVAATYAEAADPAHDIPLPDPLASLSAADI